MGQTRTASRRLAPGCHPELMAKDLCQLDDATAQPGPSVNLALIFAEWVRMTIIRHPAILVMPGRFYWASIHRGHARIFYRAPILEVVQMDPRLLPAGMME